MSNRERRINGYLPDPVEMYLSSDLLLLEEVPLLLQAPLFALGRCSLTAKCVRPRGARTTAAHSKTTKKLTEGRRSTTGSKTASSCPHWGRKRKPSTVSVLTLEKNKVKQHASSVFRGLAPAAFW